MSTETKRAAPARGGMSWIRVLRLAGLLAVAILLALWLGRKANRFETLPGLSVGETAPALVAAGWLNGDAPTEKSLRGKVVFVSAWGTHCPYCEQEAPELVALHKEFGDRVLFVGLTDAGTKHLRDVESFIERNHLAWPNGYGAMQTLINFECEAYPMDWIIGKDGKIAWNSNSQLQDGISMAEGLRRALAAK